MKKWTYDACREIALTCKTKAEFKRKSGSAYSVARTHAWLKDYVWFVSGYGQERPWGRGRRKWNKENVYGLASQCGSRSEFCRRFQSAYKVAVEEKWIDEWFKNKKAMFTHSNVLEIAMKCTSRGDLQKQCPSAYNAARRNGWLEEFTWFEDHREDFEYGKIYSVYRYMFPDGSVYIGLTRCKTARDRQHKLDCSSSVSRHLAEMNRERELPEALKVHRDYKCIGKEPAKAGGVIYTGFGKVKYPRMELLEDGLTASEARDRESFWVEKHKENGCSMLNVARTGKHSGSLGACSRKWTKRRCYEEAKRFKSKGDFQKGSPSAYEKARRCSWLKDYDWMNFKSAQCGVIRGMTDDQYEKFVSDLISDFKSWKNPRYKLCKKYGISWNTVRRILIQNKVHIPVVTKR